jgi:hypothetical protein
MSELLLKKLSMTYMNNSNCSNSSGNLYKRTQTGIAISKLFENKHNLITKAQRFNKIKM